MDAHSCHIRRTGQAVLFALLLASGTMAQAGPIFLPVGMTVTEESPQLPDPATPASLANPPLRVMRDPATEPRPDHLELVRPPAPLPALNANPAAKSPPADESARWAIYRVNPRGTIEITLNQPLLLVLGSEPLRFLSSSPRVQAAKLAAHEMSLTGTELGESALHLWFAEPGDPKKVFAVAYLVHVRAERDTLADQTQPQALQRLQAQINQAFPDGAVRLTVVGQHVVISGQTKDRAESEAIAQLVQGNTHDLPEHVHSPLMVTKPPLSDVGRTMPNSLRVINVLRACEGK